MGGVWSERSFHMNRFPDTLHLTCIHSKQLETICLCLRSHFVGEQKCFLITCNPEFNKNMFLKIKRDPTFYIIYLTGTKYIYTALCMIVNVDYILNL